MYYTIHTVISMICNLQLPIFNFKSICKCWDPYREYSKFPILMSWAEMGFSFWRSLVFRGYAHALPVWRCWINKCLRCHNLSENNCHTAITKKIINLTTKVQFGTGTSINLIELQFHFSTKVSVFIARQMWMVPNPRNDKVEAILAWRKSALELRHFINVFLFCVNVVVFSCCH